MASVASLSAYEAYRENDPRRNDVALQDKLDLYEQSVEISWEAMRRSQKSVDYYENRQWTDEEIRVFKRRKQPVVTENHIQPKVDYLMGLEITTRTDPKAFPRNPEDEMGAEGATDAVRFVLDNNKFQAMASQCWGDKLKAGPCGVEVGVRRGRDGQMKIVIERYKWDRLFADPHSRMQDYSDARYLGAVLWMNKRQALAQYKGKEAAIHSAMAFGQTPSDQHDDRPRFKIGYADQKLGRVMIIYMWYRDANGAWHWCKFTRGGILEESRSPYVNEDGGPYCPFLMDAAYKDSENNAYGFVEYMRSTQDEINHRRQRALYLLSRRGVVMDEGAVSMPDEQIRDEIAKPDYVIRKNPGTEFDVDTGSDLSQGQALLLQEAQTHMDRLGPNATMIGKDDKSQSGRARSMQSQAGFVEIQPLLDGHREFKRRVYETVWLMIKQFWTEERWVRVTDDEGKARFVGLNQPVQKGEYVAYLMKERGMDDETVMGTVQRMMATGEAHEIVRKNDVGRMRMDFMIEEVPDHATVQSEAFEQLLNFMPNLIQVMQISPPLAAAIVEASPLRNKKAIIEALKGGPEDPQAQQQQAIQSEIQLRGAMAEVGKREGEAAKAQAEAIYKQVQAEREAAEAEALPIKVDTDAMKAQAAYIQAVTPDPQSSLF